MRKMLILSLLLFALSFLTASDYEAGADFRIDNMMMFDYVNDQFFSDFEAIVVHVFLAGLDFGCLQSGVSLTTLCCGEIFFILLPSKKRSGLEDESSG